MKILHITPHLGGGVGTVICDWMTKASDMKEVRHLISSCDTINQKASIKLYNAGVLGVQGNMVEHPVHQLVSEADIVLVHYWHHPMLKEFLSHSLPPCRLVFWCHNNSPYSQEELNYPDLWVDTSPIQGHGRHIWSTGDMTRFHEIKPKPHEGFNIGYVGTVDYKKIHNNFVGIFETIKELIADARFTIVGEDNVFKGKGNKAVVNFTGKVDDVAPYLAEMDVFAYPLRPDHYGTCEIALGEAMAAGVVPVVMDNPCESEIIISGVTGLISRNEKEYVENIVDMSFGLRELHSKACRDRASHLYSIDTMIQQWNEVFHQMMEKPKQLHDFGGQI